MNPEVELVTTGAELLDGRVVNRHANWLGNQLELIGWRLLRDTTVADEPDQIRDAIQSAFQRTPIVIVTGGLGPTSDDVTREVAAEWFGTKIVMHEPTRQTVLDLYKARNKPLNATVERHALVVDGAAVLANHHGLAPGEHLSKNDRHLFLLPGPPREFQGVMRDHVLPWLSGLGIASASRIHLFQTAGLGESDIAAKLEATGFELLNLEKAYCAEPGKVTIRIREKSGFSDDFIRSSTLVDHALGASIYSRLDESIEQTVGRLLKENHATVSVAESCTGGLIGQRLTAISGSSVYMRGGVIAYHNDIKADLLGVDRTVLESHGAVSEQVAGMMAAGVRSITGSDYGLSVTGIAGPDGGTAEKPVGLVFIAVAGRSAVEVRQLNLGGGRETIREASATMAMDLLRRCINKQAG